MSGRIRSLKPEWNDDEALIYCSPAARTLSASFLLLADDHGNGRFVAASLAPRLFPAYPELFAPAVSELMAINYLTLYRVEGQTYFSVRNWKKHQRVDNAGKPRVPGPETESAESLREIPRLAEIRGWIPIPTTIKDQDHDHDPIPNEREKKSPKPKKARAPSAPSADAAGYSDLVGLWFDCYERRYGAKPAWGAVYGRQLKAIVAKSSVDELRRLIPAFFAWKRPEVIKAGHSLSTGFASLSQKLDELRADLLHPERRAFAAMIAGDEKQAIHNAEGDAQTARVVASILGDEHDPFRPLTGRSATADGRDSIPGGSAQPATIGRGDPGVVRSASPVHARQSLVGGLAVSDRGRAHAEHSPLARAVAWPPGDAAVEPTADDDHAGEGEG